MNQYLDVYEWLDINTQPSWCRLFIQCVLIAFTSLRNFLRLIYIIHEFRNDGGYQAIMKCAQCVMNNNYMSFQSRGP